MSRQDRQMMTKRIMIVEDEMSAAAALEIELGARGCEILPVVVSSEAAVRQAGTQKPDVVLMDVGIYGKLSGIEAADTIRERFGIPVVFITGDDNPDTLAKANRVNHSGYVIKPIAIDALMKIIKNAT